MRDGIPAQPDKFLRVFDALSARHRCRPAPSGAAGPIFLCILFIEIFARIARAGADFSPFCLLAQMKPTTIAAKKAKAARKAITFRFRTRVICPLPITSV
ncbi:hypothetical protein [Roseibium sp.]|uniref:hypothetical protein n=1 Tax=Roseibium sp. TaxID=1936156 RepID=UPI003264494C